MIKTLQIFFVLCLFARTSNGQQLFNYSHNLIVPGIQNPAFARYNDEISFNLIRKSAFGSFEGAPVDNSFYFSSPINAKNGIGLSLNQNQQGIFKELNANIQYARSFNITEYLKLGLGVSAGVKNQSINFDDIVAFNLSDPFLVARQEQNTTYDASFGMYLTTSKFLFRAAVPQMLGNRMGDGYQKLDQHILSSVQYKFPLKNSLVLTPVVGVDYMLNAPISYNAGFLLHYKTVFWAGAQYKSDYSISPIVGLSYKKISLSYSYDYSGLTYTNLGLGHEILLQFKMHRNTNNEGNISSREAEERIIELIDEYFDVQSSDIDLFERLILMRKIEKEINDLMPYLDKEKKKQFKNKINKKKASATPPTNPPKSE